MSWQTRRLVPELVKLEQLLDEAIFDADPIRANPIRETAGRPSVEAPREGHDTVGARRRVDEMRRYVGWLCSDFEQLLGRFGDEGPGAFRLIRRAQGPQCRRRGCEAGRRRQASGSRFCGWCGQPFPTKETT